MNKKFPYFFLIILPILLFITGYALKYAQGPYYYFNFYDPSYVYLINSLNLAQLAGYSVGHFDHPGTPVQVIGAFIIRLYHWMSNGNNDIVIDVLSRPEAYLSIANKIFIMINCITLYLLGLFTFKISRNLVLSLLIQLSPFASVEIFYGLIIVTPDNFLIAVTLIFIGFLIYYLFRINENTNSPLSYVILFAVTCGLGFASKINFLPLLIIPLLLINGLKNKIIFLVSVFLSFILFVSPVISNYAKFIEWIEKLFLYSGHYGEGAPTIINSSEFATHLKLIFQKDNFFAALYFLTFIILIIKLFVKPLTDTQDGLRIRKVSKVLFAIFLAMTIQIIFVAKQYGQHYMIPSFLLSVTSVTLCASIVTSIFRRGVKNFRIKYLYLLIIAITSSWGLAQILLSYNEGSFQRDEAFKVIKFINENCSDDFLISSFGSSSQQCALAFSVSYAGDQTAKYQSILSSLQPNHIFYNPWINKFYALSNKTDIKKSLLDHKRIILQIGPYGASPFIKTLNNLCSLNNSSYITLFKNGNNESIYEIKIGDK